MQYKKIFPVALICATILPSSFTQAAQWKQLKGYGAAYIDTASVRFDQFPKMSPTGITQFINGQPPTEKVAVAWLRLAEGGASFQLEVAFDCQGNMGVIQQIVVQQTQNSPYSSFDNTALFRQSGVQKRSVAPDTSYEAAERFACALKPPAQQ